MQGYEYFLFAASCAHMVCITFQSSTDRYGPVFFLRHPDMSIVDGLELALLILYTCAALQLTAQSLCFPSRRKH